MDLLNDSQYVLTPDYAMKMLTINECMNCKSPVVICGETGVGKTFLIEMISKLWNLSIIQLVQSKQDSLIASLSKMWRAHGTGSLPFIMKG